jgi:phosphoribosyl 1,2-cyclic phosphodiesterase
MPKSNFTVTFLGVGGSCAVSTPLRARYGANTPCVLAEAGGRLAVFDMGTGLHRLPEIVGEVREADILLSHFHYDHIQGMPYFPPFFREGRYDIYARAPEGSDVKSVLSDLMRTPYHPVSFAGFRADIRCHDLEGAEFTTASGLNVATVALNHPGGCTGYRLEYEGRLLVYLCDHEYSPSPEHGHAKGEENDEPVIINFCKNADLVVYDAFVTAAEYAGGKYTGWGHSHHEAGLDLAEAAGAKRIAFMHHAAWRTDAELDTIAEEIRARNPEAYMAAEGMRISL